MKTWMVALVTGALLTASAAAADTAKGDDMLSHMVLGASVDSWNVMNGATAIRDDAEVKGGKALRVTVHKGANPWDTQASIAVPQAVQKGDILFVAFFARIETPPAGATTGIITQAGIQLAKAPYTALAAEQAAPTGKWATYYASGVADDDHSKGALTITLHLAAADQVIDLGPAFMFNLGPNWDRTKLPHNRLAAAAAPAPAATPAGEAAYAADLAKLRAKLPVKGTLITDPSLVYTYGPDITGQPITAAEVTGGKATRTVTAKAGAHPYDDGASTPVTTTIKKGDVIFTAVQVRVPAPTTVPEFGVHLAGAPYTAIATASANLPANQWTWIYASGAAATDYPAGSVSFGMQLGAAAETVDVGPVIVLDLGSGVDPVSLPGNK